MINGERCIDSIDLNSYNFFIKIEYLLGEKTYEKIFGNIASDIYVVLF